MLRRNIDALANVRRRFDERRPPQARIADAITGFTGSMKFVLLHALLIGGWITVNTGAVPGVKPFDPYPFVMLAMIASCEAIFLSTFVLISQNRMSAVTSQRDELDVQISLLAEHEITRLIVMVEALMKHHGVPVARPDELAELKCDVNPEKVVDQIAQADETPPEEEGGQSSAGGR